SNMDGEYEISVPEGSILVFSFVGYVTQEIPVDNQTSLNVTLDPDILGIDEVVLIGYGTAKKGDATGSVIAVDSKDFNQGNITTPQELLMGKAAGVVITAPSGQPGAKSTIRIRGGSSLRANNDPLIVIDGFPIDNTDMDGTSNPLATLNPNDIEKFTVLKDASATAIYGLRASNGVILITTKRGSKGKFTASYNGSVSLGVPIKYLKVYNGDEFRALIQDRVDNHGLTPEALTKLGNANTDWQKEIYQNAFSHDHNVALSGAVNVVPYRVSIGYTDQNGILKNSSMNRTTLDLSLNPAFLDGDLKFDFNVKGAYTNNDFSNEDAIGSALEFDPSQPVKNGNTRYGGYTAWVEASEEDQLNGIPNNIATHNPVARLKYRDNKSDVQRYIGNLQVDYKLPFLRQLKATLRGGYDYYNSRGHDYTDPLASWSYREIEQNKKNYAHTRRNGLFDFYLNYNEYFAAVHQLDLTAGYSYQSFYREGYDANQPWEKTDGEYKNANLKAYKNENFLISFFGRANYSLMERYLLTATLRYDGSSRFAKENRWGLFPAFALAWKISNENFLQGVGFLSNLKLRLGYGVTGQQDISDNYYPYIPAYTISQPGAYYQFGDNFYPTQRPDAYDANIQWETTTTINAGLDVGFWDNRLMGSFDVYQRTTDDLLNEIPIAAGTNFSNFLTTNVGSLENKGFEMELIGRAISTTDMSLRIAVNYTYNQNEITKLTLVDDPSYTGYDDGDIAGGVGNKIQINSVGHPANTFFMFKQVYGSDGKPIEGLYVDKTGQGGNVAGNNLNKYYLQNPAPDHLIGISASYTYKQFDFSFSGRANLDNYVYNNNASSKALYQMAYNQSGFTRNILTDVEKTGFMTAQYWSDFYLENASFFRMDNINLGYSFDRFLTDRISGRVGITVQNAFVITKYSGLDPEVEEGIDDTIFPRPRTFMLGLNLNF
ncbi:MAG: hypothetical protein AMS23_08520, partial [Bacteroides sp. SM1_62]